MYYLGICAIIKNETPFLAEWVAYYMHLGVEAFYLYDNQSEEPIKETLRNFARSREKILLKVFDVPGKAMQMPVYNHCVEQNQNTCRWIAFVDLDEFIVPKLHETLPSLLEEFESHAGLSLHWKLFGSNGHKLRPAGLQIENYTKTMPDDFPVNQHVKSIVNPRSVKFFFNPHMCCLLKSDEHVVTEDHAPIAIATRPNPSWEKGQINHYYFRSRQDYALKMRSPRADIFGARVIPENLAPPEGDITDTCAVRFASGVKTILDRTAAES